MKHVAAAQPQDFRHRLESLIHHLEHVLPAQAPIRDFVHHNTLHGYQHLPFPEALASARRITGIYGYLRPAEFRELHRQGRIDARDLDQALREDEGLGCDEKIGPLTRMDVYRVLLLHDVPALTACQLNWQTNELAALSTFQSDVPQATRERLLASAGTGERLAVADLWQACLEKFGMRQQASHLEELLDLSAEQAERLLGRLAVAEDAAEPFRIHRLLRHESDRILDTLLDRVGPELTLRGLLLRLTGVDILDQLRPALVRHLAAYLDHGMAAWRNPDRSLGFYHAWRRCALADPGPMFRDFPDWHETIAELPDEAAAVIEEELTLLGLAGERWESYLERLALELPGWSGMMMWRHLHPGYERLDPDRIDIVEYLAVRLILERLYAQRLCRSEWQVEPRLDILRWHFRRRRTELLVRWTMFNEHLPEYLVSRAHDLRRRTGASMADELDWQRLAHMIWTWRLAMASDPGGERTTHGHAWPLFRLAQLLGFGGQDIRMLSDTDVAGLFDCRARLDADRAGPVWLKAYERRYRDQILNALAGNRGRGRWSSRNDRRPAAQVVFCMDDREEGFRRHLEEHDPAIETLGAAGFFGVPIHWQGLDDVASSALCPIVVTPSNTVRERPRPDAGHIHAAHVRRLHRRRSLKGLVFQNSHRGVFVPAMVQAVAAAGALALLAAKVLAPRTVGRLVEKTRASFDLAVPTALDLTAPDDGRPATPSAPRQGFTDREQADRVEGFLRMVGLTSGFAPLVVIMGHGSTSQNNPHLAAYDCGACSGRHGGPNARVFAAIANRPEVRALLAARGLALPDDTWFMGAEHNTCDESILWFDHDLAPPSFADARARLENALEAARAGSAHERARRLASAPRRGTPGRALAHMEGRARDFSQARPELGHVTNAVAVIGRRSMTQGAFFDRRMFLISYDPTLDPDGRIVESILLNAGPVGAGIALEYYFSTVDNDRFGCGTKVVHNVTGFFGVMEGTSSDLRTGLPRQMIEIHEAMRLLVVVEQTPEILTAIYQRQPVIQELVGNAWIQLACMDPAGGAIHIFTPGRGFEAWSPDPSPLPLARKSAEWYAGHDGPLPPALIANPEAPHG